jgi:hypothetical protein
MFTSDNVDQIATAFALAQLELENPPKNKINPHYNSKYVDLSDGLEKVRKVFGKHGIAFIQATRADGDIIILHTRLIHKSGQWIESTYPVCGLDKHQSMGSALTYARRYSLFSMVGVAGEDDNDGNDAAMAKPLPKKEKEPKFTKQESEEMLSDMVEALQKIDNLKDLSKWASENQVHKVRMMPAHQNEISALFIEIQNYLKQENA